MQVSSDDETENDCGTGAPSSEKLPETPKGWIGDSSAKRGYKSTIYIFM